MRGILWHQNVAYLFTSGNLKASIAFYEDAFGFKVRRKDFQSTLYHCLSWFGWRWLWAWIDIIRPRTLCNQWRHIALSTWFGRFAHWACCQGYRWPSPKVCLETHQIIISSDPQWLQGRSDSRKKVFKNRWNLYFALRYKFLTLESF